VIALGEETTGTDSNDDNCYDDSVVSIRLGIFDSDIVHSASIQHRNASHPFPLRNLRPEDGQHLGVFLHLLVYRVAPFSPTAGHG
jgi:hypothetical protein